jgi:hypothetical protein
MATALSVPLWIFIRLINPMFQLAKTMATESLNAYKSTGSLPEEKPQLVGNNLSFYGDEKATTQKDL